MSMRERVADRRLRRRRRAAASGGFGAGRVRCGAARRRRRPGRRARGTAAPAGPASAPARRPRRRPSRAASGCRRAGAIRAASARALHAALGDHDAGGGGDQQRRDLRDQAVADGQRGEGGERRRRSGMPCRSRPIARPPTMLIDGDDQAGDGVAADELRGAVHGAVEAAFLLQLAAAAARGLLVDQRRPRGRRRSPSACPAWHPG